MLSGIVNNDSIEKSPTEEYWSNYRHISPQMSNPINININSDLKIKRERGSSRLSAANDIIFGSSGGGRRLLSNNESPLLEPRSSIAQFQMFNDVSKGDHQFRSHKNIQFLDVENKNMKVCHLLIKNKIHRKP